MQGKPLDLTFPLCQNCGVTLGNDLAPLSLSSLFCKMDGAHGAQWSTAWTLASHCRVFKNHSPASA